MNFSSKLLVFVVFSISIILCNGAIDVASLFSGEWHIWESTVDFSEKDANFDGFVHSWILNKDTENNEELPKIFGKWFINDTSTNRTVESVFVQVLLQDTISGEFLIGDDIYDLKTLFSFEFSQLPNGNLISIGNWEQNRLTQYQGFYQFIIARDTFTLEIWGDACSDNSKESDGSESGSVCKENSKKTHALWVGNVKHVSEPLPWYKRYFTPMMIGLIVINLLGKGFIGGKTQ